MNKRIDTMTAGLSLMAVAALMATPVLGQTLLSHDFSSGDRTIQNLPASSAWYKGGGTSASLDAAVGSLSFSTTATSHLVATNFVNNTAGYTLPVGEGIRMRYTFAGSAVASGNAFNTDNRMGLFSYAAAPASRPFEDLSSANGPGGGAGTPVLGYMFNFHVSDALAPMPFNIFKRTNTVNTNLLSTGGDYTNLGTSSVIAAAGGLLTGASYTLEFEIMRTDATTAVLTTTYLDGVGNILAKAMATDTAASDAQLTFDAFLYRAASMNNKGGIQTITAFEVAVVPEPATYAALLGLLALAAVIRRRAR